MEKAGIVKAEDVEEADIPIEHDAGEVARNTEMEDAGAAGVSDISNVVLDELVDIHRYRFNGLFSNSSYSTNPILPKYHVTFGAPLDR